MFGADNLNANFGCDLDRLAVEEPRPAFDDLDVGLLQQRGDAAAQAADDPILPLHRPGKVESRRGKRNAERAFTRCELRDPREFIGGMDQRLGWDAADIEAGAARFVRLDHHGVDAELSRPDRADIAAGSRADHQKPARYVPHGVNRPRRSALASPAAS